MTTVRGYEWGESNPRHEVQKRTYRDCTGCGKRTWSPRALCANCSGTNEARYNTIVRGQYANENEFVGERVYELLRDTDMAQLDIAELVGVEPNYVSRIRCGRTLSALTGGYVLRPYERES